MHLSMYTYREVETERMTKKQMSHTNKKRVLSGHPSTQYTKNKSLSYHNFVVVQKSISSSLLPEKREKK